MPRAAGWRVAGAHSFAYLRAVPPASAEAHGAGGLMSGKETTISVALTTYNGCPFIGPQLESIAGQLRRPDELVVGDDQSSDGTAAVVERFAASSGIPTHWQRNATRLGFVRNFEHVVTRCSGDIVVFADHDDVWAPRKLQRLEAALRDDPDALGVFSNGALIGEHGQRLRGTLFEKCRFHPAERAAFRDGNALGVLVKRNVVTGATLAVRRAALLRVLPFDACWPHDYYLALALSVLGRLLVIDEPLVHYRRHARQQIGFPNASWSGLLELVHGQNADACRQESAAFGRLCERLISLGVDPALPVLEALRGKGRQLAQRAEMRSRRRRAPGLMWRSLRDGDYRQYGVGWGQLVLDVVALGVRAGSAPR